MVSIYFVIEIYIMSKYMNLQKTLAEINEVSCLNFGWLCVSSLFN